MTNQILLLDFPFELGFEQEPRLELKPQFGLWFALGFGQSFGQQFGQGFNLGFQLGFRLGIGPEFSLVLGQSSGKASG